MHPRFLHSNATSHKWALGALVELLDNSVDEVSAGEYPSKLDPVIHVLRPGCTYVIIDKVDHPLAGPDNPMLLVEDNGGGMDPKTIRNCMSFGFSLKHGTPYSFMFNSPEVPLNRKKEDRAVRQWIQDLDHAAGCRCHGSDQELVCKDLQCRSLVLYLPYRDQLSRRDSPNHRLRSQFSLKAILT